MYAALSTITVSPGMWSQMCSATDKMYAAIKGMKGFKSATFFGDNATGKYNSLVLWDSKADAEAAQSDLRGQTEKALVSVLKEPVARQACEVYVP
jgi:heme-degrading monooxygenase HmoA